MKTFRFLFGYARNYTKALVVTVLSMTALVGVQLLAPWMIRTMIALVKEPANLDASMQTILRLAVLTFFLYIARAVLRFLRSYMSHVHGNKFTVTFRSCHCDSMRISRLVI